MDNEDLFPEYTMIHAISVTGGGYLYLCIEAPLLLLQGS